MTTAPMTTLIFSARREPSDAPGNGSAARGGAG
jgi:hypothetical protein